MNSSTPLISSDRNTKAVSRRKFLKIAGVSVGAGTLACSGLGMLAIHQPKIEIVKTSCGTEDAMKKGIVVYASRCGSTGEIAQAIGQELCQNGLSVDIRRVQEVRDLSPYDFVVLGSAVRNGKLYDEVLNFARKHRHDLSRVPTAYFFSGITMNTDTPEHRQTAMSVLEPLVQIQKPAGVGLFGGKIDPTKLPPMWRFMLSWVKEGDMAPGDHRNWEAIRSWAGEAGGLLSVKEG